MTGELNDAINRILDAHVSGDGFYETPAPGLILMRWSDGFKPIHMNYRPKLCLVTQGAKQVIVAEKTIEYRAGQSLVVTIDVPVLSQIVDASPAKPFVGATLSLDPEIVLDVATSLNGAGSADNQTGFGLMVNDLDTRITGSILRLLGLIGQPQAMAVLYPSIMREIVFWLLMGPAGAAVARMVLPDGQAARIGKAITHIRQNFDAPIGVAELAKQVGMSPSSFHQHFKNLTSMSPLQYQKHLRLLEARRLMVADGEKAGVAAIAVGYESVSQFSREYARMFGSPPRRETRRAGADDALSDAEAMDPAAINNAM